MADEIGRESWALYTRDSVVLAGIEKLRFFPAAIVRGKGAQLEDADGRWLIDLTASWTACGLGYAHPKVAEAVCAAVRDHGYMGLSMSNPAAVDLAERLVRITPGPAERRKVYLGHAGSDACDVAFRCLRRATGKRKIIAFEHSYHGGFGTAMAASGVHVEGGSAEHDPDVVFVPYPNPFRPSHKGLEEDVRSILHEIELHAKEGAACIAVEPILSDGGLIVPPDGFLASVVQIGRQTGTLVLCDEVKMGLARIFHWSVV